jgi:tetratricopeptide (TPR) repeat protein
MTQNKTYYSILGIETNANFKEIKKAYRKIALEYHPDHNKEANAEEKFKEINEIYQTLSDPRKRAKYNFSQKIKKYKKREKKSIKLNQIDLKKNDKNNINNATFLKAINLIQKFFFHLLFFLTPLYFNFKNEELFEFNKMILVYFIGLSLVATWLIKIIYTKKITFKKTIFDWPILLFLISQIISTIISIHPYTSLFGYYTRFNGGLLSTITYILIFYTIVNNLEKKDLPKLIFTNLTSAFLVSLYGILEHFGYSFSCLLATNQFNDACWVQDVQSRVFASFGQPNWLASYLTMLIPINLVLLLKNKEFKLKVWQTVILLLNFPILILAVFFTKSKSGLLALIISLFFLILNLSLQKKLNTKKIKLFIISIVVIIILGFSTFTKLWQKIDWSNFVNFNYQTNLRQQNDEKAQIFTQLLQDNQFEDQTLKTIPASIYPTNSLIIRKVVWQGALNIFKRYPIFGSGVETFAYSYYQDRPVEHNLISEWDFLYNKAHNEFLNFLATTGIVGLSLYLVICLSPFIYFYKDKTNRNSLNLAILTGLVAMHITNFFGFSIVMTNVLFFSFLAFFALNIKQKIDNSNETKISSFLEKTQHFNFAITLILFFFIFSQISKIWLADFHYAKSKAKLQSSLIEDGINELQQAIRLRPKEALYYDHLANILAQLAIYSHESQADPEIINSYLLTSIQALNKANQLNHRHLNFYKTRAKIFRSLSQIDNKFNQEAIKTLEESIKLSPTESKLKFELSQIYQEENNLEKAKKYLLEAIKQKNNYLEARLDLAKIYQKQNKYTEAIAQYLYLDSYIVENEKRTRQGIRECNEKLGIDL